ncbi:hypothetical protein [Secundilactobacillus kimchicus]|uniref:GyrI-like small molecule binding domain-containing protein n=1 Tax=Secundilactobacillus kimchicus JCM 15530 TaxID=1302272 RepID=A0A0R1I108_9LACO|nr:hypothetical protein [Secundilactobacillus kimchicus]KRK48967.1 hypothetical protein FC96_GL001288 [Secundilactobacillus kimchicus JCM 15530]
MVQFDWQIAETNEYSRSATPSFVTLTTRSYLTISGVADQRTADSEFQEKARAVERLAQKISDGPDGGIHIDRFKSYRPYPVQAVWSGGETVDDRHAFKIWLKQPLFVSAANLKQARDQLDVGPLGPEVQFENLAEGTEIQSFSADSLTTDSQAVETLRQAIADRGLKRLSETQHREVYLEGPEAGRPVLLRVEIDPNQGQIDASNHAYN